MNNEITLNELLPNDFYINKDNKMVAEITLEKANIITDILVKYHNKVEQLQEERKTLYRYTPEKGFELVGDDNG